MQRHPNELAVAFLTPPSVCAIDPSAPHLQPPRAGKVRQQSVQGTSSTYQRVYSGLTVSEGESVAIKAGSMAVGRHGTEALPKFIYLDLQARGRES